MKPCFGYIRVSTAKQGEGVSLDAQRDAIMAFASRENLAVVRWFEERETAAKKGRPVFNQMLRLLKRGGARGLIMHKIDRSARNLRDWSVVTELPDVGIDVYIATETLDFRSRGGRLTADIQAVIAADYIRNLREETIKGLNGRLKQGLYPFRAPIGYLDAGRGKPKTPDPAKAPLIKKAFELYADGQHGLRSLQAHMNKLGLRNLAGQPVTLHGIATILNNPFYCGIIEIKRTGKTWEGIHKPIISPRLFKHVQDRKAGRAGKKVTKHNHLFRGVFRCGLCNAPMVPERQKGRVYYRCKIRQCPTKTVREDFLDGQLRQVLDSLQLSDDQVNVINAKWMARLEDESAEQAKKGIELRISENLARTNRLTDLLIDGTISASDYDERKRSLAMDLANLKQDLSENLAQQVRPEEIDQFILVMRSIGRLYDAANNDEKRRLLDQVFEKCSVSLREVQLMPRDWILGVRSEHCEIPTRLQMANFHLDGLNK